LKILGLSYNAGSGVNRASRLLYDAIKTEFDLKYILSNENSVYYFYNLLRLIKPDVVVLQDLFPFITEAVASYKLEHKLKSFLYTTYDSIEPMDDKGLEMIDHFFVPEKNECCFSRSEVPQTSNEFYFPLEANFDYKREWSGRKNFVYVGRVDPSKLDHSILNVLGRSDQHLDVYGGICDKDYFGHCSNSPWFRYKGYRGNYAMPSVYNNYKFHILFSETDCFSISSLEAAACGCIPIIIRYPIIVFKWCAEYSFQLEKLKQFKDLLPLLLTKDLTHFATEISEKVKTRYNLTSFMTQFKEYLAMPNKEYSILI